MNRQSLTAIVTLVLAPVCGMAALPAIAQVASPTGSNSTGGNSTGQVVPNSTGTSVAPGSSVQLAPTTIQISPNGAVQQTDSFGNPLNSQPGVNQPGQTANPTVLGTQAAPGNIQFPNSTVQVAPNGNVQVNGTQPSTVIPAGSAPLVNPTGSTGIQTAPNGTVQNGTVQNGNVQVLPGNTVQTNPNGNVQINNPTTNPGNGVAPNGVQTSPNGNVQIVPTNNGQPLPNANPQSGGTIGVPGNGTQSTPGTATPGIQSGTPVIQIQTQPVTNSGVNQGNRGSGASAPANQPPIALPTNLPGALDVPLLRATCAQNWGQAVQIVDRAIAVAPRDQTAYRAQLSECRNRLQILQAKGVRAANWQQECTQGLSPVATR